jgi:putative tributyrin esterase
MALCTIHFRSEAIQKHDTMQVIVPDGPGPFPVLYLLHGLTCDYAWWNRFLAVERLVADRGLMVVMPDTHRCFYVNDPRPGGFAYEDHLIQDVLGFVDRVFPTIRDRRGRAVAGISMGGYGALMLALRHPDLFVATANISGALLFAHDTVHRDDNIPWLSQAMAPEEYDLWRLAERYAQGGPPLAIRCSCGAEDGLLGYNRDWSAHLTRLGIPHEYVEHPGAHDWTSWVTQTPAAIDFCAHHLGLGATAAEG